MTDPTGHKECDLETLNCSGGTGSYKPPPSSALPQAPEPPSDLITHLPLDRNTITGQSGFGPNSYSNKYCKQACYPQSHNIHTGLDFFISAESAAKGTIVYASVSGTIVAEYDTDGEPNVVIAVMIGEITFYIVHGHVRISEGMMGKEVKAGDPIGTVVDQGNNSHVHLGLRLDINIENRAYNPLLFMDPELTVGMNFVSDDYPYYGTESPTSMRSFLYGTGSYFDENNRASMGIIR